MIRLLFKGTKDIGKGNPMKLAGVQVPKGAPYRKPAAKQENLPF